MIKTHSLFIFNLAPISHPGPLHKSCSSGGSQAALFSHFALLLAEFHDISLGPFFPVVEVSTTQHAKCSS